MLVGRLSPAPPLRRPLAAARACSRAPAPLPAPAGELPESWSKLEVLQGLDLSDNRITGDLPASWGALNNLQVGRADGNWAAAGVRLQQAAAGSVERAAAGMPSAQQGGKAQSSG